MLPECERFKSAQTDLVLFPAVIAVVTRATAQEAWAQRAPLLLKLGDWVGDLLGDAWDRVFKLDAHRDRGPEVPDPEPMPLVGFLGASEPTTLLQAQVPREIRGSPKWPKVESFRQVNLFPRSAVRAIEVKWASAIILHTTDGGCFRTDINFWNTERLRSTLRGWGYPLM